MMLHDFLNSNFDPCPSQPPRSALIPPAISIIKLTSPWQWKVPQLFISKSDVIYISGGWATPLKNISQVRLDYHPNSWGKWNIHVPKPPTRSPSYSHCCWMYTLLTTIKITIAIVVGLFNGTSPFLMGKLTINGHFHIMKIYWWHWWFSRYLPADPLDKRPLGLISEVHGATNATRFVRQALGKKRLENHWKTHFQNGFSHGFSHGFFLILDVLDCSGGFSVVF